MPQVEYSFTVEKSDQQARQDEAAFQAVGRLGAIRLGDSESRPDRWHWAVGAALIPAILAGVYRRRVTSR